MSHYYATIQGSRQPKTCTGHKTNGIDAKLECLTSPTLFVRRCHKDGEERVWIHLGDLQFHGTVEALADLLRHGT